MLENPCGENCRYENFVVATCKKACRQKQESNNHRLWLALKAFKWHHYCSTSQLTPAGGALISHQLGKDEASA